MPRTFVKTLDSRRIRRIYSLACSREQGYELSIKMTGGPGPSFLASLEVGQSFEASAPYGDFFYRPQPGRSICFVPSTRAQP